MTAILDGGRSFPFAGVSTDLVEQRGNASDYNNKLEQLAICNHKHLPLSGEKAPPVMGDQPPASCAARTFRPPWRAAFYYTLLCRFLSISIAKSPPARTARGSYLPVIHFLHIRPAPVHKSIHSRQGQRACRGNDQPFRQEFRQRADGQAPDDAAHAADHLEHPVEPRPLAIRHIRLHRRCADGVGGHAQHAVQEEPHRHQRYRQEQQRSGQHIDGHIDAECSGKLPLLRDVQPVLHRAAQQTARRCEIAQDGVQRRRRKRPGREPAGVVQEVGQLELLRAGNQAACHEVQGNEQQAPLPTDIVQPLPKVPAELPEGVPVRCPGRLVHMGFLTADRDLCARGNQEADRVDGKQLRRAAQPVVEHRRQRAGQAGQVCQQPIDGVRFLEIPPGDEVGIKAVIGHHVDAVDGPGQEADRQQPGIAEPSAPQQQEQQGVYPGGQEVQGIDRPFPAHAVQIRPCQHRTDHDRQLEAHREEHIQER